MMKALFALSLLSLLPVLRAQTITGVKCQDVPADGGGPIAVQIIDNACPKLSDDSVSFPELKLMKVIE